MKKKQNIDVDFLSDYICPKTGKQCEHDKCSVCPDFWTKCVLHILENKRKAEKTEEVPVYHDMGEDDDTDK